MIYSVLLTILKRKAFFYMKAYLFICVFNIGDDEMRPNRGSLRSFQFWMEETGSIVQNGLLSVTEENSGGLSVLEQLVSFVPYKWEQ